MDERNLHHYRRSVVFGHIFKIFFLTIQILYQWYLRQIVFPISEERENRFGGSKVVLGDIRMCARVKISARCSTSDDSIYVQPWGEEQSGRQRNSLLDFGDSSCNVCIGDWTK